MLFQALAGRLPTLNLFRVEEESKLEKVCALYFEDWLKLHVPALQLHCILLSLLSVNRHVVQYVLFSLNAMVMLNNQIN